MKTKALKLLVLAIVLSTVAQIAMAQLPKETEAQKAQRMKWWTDARFGMFIHWGLYALPARHEWVKNRERMTNEQYQKYFEQFNPDLFNPKEWAKMAKAAGMKYVVLTSKHHEGFCLWDSKYTDYKATNTPYGKDLIKEYVEAFRAEGPEGRFLLFTHRLAPPRIHDRPGPPAAPGERRGLREAERGKGHEQVPRVHQEPGPRTAHELR